MGILLIVLVVIYLFAFQSARNGRTRFGQKKDASAPKTAGAGRKYRKGAAGLQNDDPGGPAAAADGPAGPIRSLKTKFDGSGGVHEDCTHNTVSGHFRDFEDREHDWLAQQLKEERRALRRLDF